MPPEAEVNEEQTDTPRRVPSLLKGLAFFALLLALILVSRLTPLRGLLDDVDGWRSRIDTGAAGVAVFVAASAVLLFVGVPRLALCFLGGVLFGFGKGLLASMIGTVIGAYALFAFARWTGQAWAQRRVERSPRLQRLMHEPPTIWTVVMIRQLPVPAFATNVAFGLSSVRHRVFLIGSFIGALPQATVAVLAGAGLVRGTLAEALPNYIAALGLFIVVAWFARWRLASAPATPSTSA